MTTPHDESQDIIADLSEYLDRGENPPQEILDRSPAHHIALESLLRFRSAARNLLQSDVDAEPVRDDGWVTRILADIHTESRAGRSIPFAHDAPETDLSITEGAVRGLIRAACDSVPGVLVGRCRLSGDVTALGSPTTVDVEVDVFWGDRMSSTADLIREAVSHALRRHTDLNLTAINVTVTDVHVQRDDQETEE